jgi:hypothetical protein
MINETVGKNLSRDCPSLTITVGFCRTFFGAFGFAGTSSFEFVDASRSSRITVIFFFPSPRTRTIRGAEVPGLSTFSSGSEKDESEEDELEDEDPEEEDNVASRASGPRN